MIVPSVTVNSTISDAHFQGTLNAEIQNCVGMNVNGTSADFLSGDRAYNRADQVLL